jgi:hypothetical protein
VHLSPNRATNAPAVAQSFRPLGALKQWRAELQAGVGGQRANTSSTWHLDALWLAACYEAAAFDAHSHGLDSAKHLAKAAEIITDAAKRAKGAA